MATYKISYLNGDSYSTRNESYVDNVIDEYDAVEKLVNEYNLGDIRVLKIDLISE